MNDLSNFLVESILLEADSVDNKVVVYAGRFQPFHKGHYATYSHLVKKFGKDNVYIGTSNKTDNQKSPFNFKEKKQIMTTMFGIPSNKIIEVKNPYIPTEVLKKFNEDTTAFITVVGKKDASRLGGKFFTPYKDNLDFEGYKDKGYVYIAPQQSNPISGTDVRMGLRSGSDEDKKEFFAKRAYGKFNPKIFKFIAGKLSQLPEITSEGIFIPKHIIEDWIVDNVELIKEASKIGGSSEVDDGPNFVFPSYASFDKVSKKRAEAIGYTVLSQIMSDELTDIDSHPIYPKGPVKAVTPFPAGVIGKTTATNQKDFYGSQAYNLWFKHATRFASLVGYSVLDSLDSKHDKEESSKTKKVKDPNTNIVKEDITIPINVGDTVLGGKFKNKKIVVKTIGKNDKGDITINGKPVLKVRLIEENIVVEFNGEEIKCEKCNHQWEITSNDDEKYLCHNCGFDNQSKEYDLDSLDDWKRSHNMIEEISSEDRTLIYQLTTKALKTMPNSPKQKEIIKQLNKVRVKNGMKPLKENFLGITLNEASLTISIANIVKDLFPKEFFYAYKPNDVEQMKATIGDLVNTLNRFYKQHNVKVRFTNTDFKYKMYSKEGIEVELNEFGGTRFDAIGYDKSGKKVDMYLPRANDGFMKNIVNAAADKLFKGGKGVEYIEVYYDKHHLGTIKKPKTFTKGKDWGKLPINEIPMGDLQKIDTFADKQFKPVDVVLTGKHFFDRLNDPRNGKEVTNAELIGFFKRLGKKKKEFVSFLNQYNQIVAKDNRTNLNIPFMKQANKIIAKTIMRKDDFKTSSPEYKFESLPTKISDKYKPVNLDPNQSELEKDFNKHHQTSTIAKRGSLAEPDTIDFDDDDKMGGHQSKEKDTEKRGYEPVTEQLAPHGYPYQKWIDDHNKELKKLRKKFDKEELQYNEPYALSGGISEDTIKRISKSLGVDRKDMPQINSKDVSDFVTYLKRNNVSVSASTIDVSKIGMTQKNLNVDKVKALLDVEKSNLSKPVIISKDNYILDGHHRVAALYNLDKNFKLKTIKVGLGIKDLLKIAKEYPKVSYKSINESEEMIRLKELLNEILLTEGGAYGHMNHPFDTEINLTFGQLKDIVNKALEGNLELAREKTDGQALAVSWRDGRLVAARNKGHLKNKGENALDINGVATKFAGRGELEKAYNFAMNDLSKAIKSLSDKQREKVFKGGACFMNLEVIYPTSVNVIPYGQALLVFHGTMEYNEDGIAIGENQEAARILAGMIKQVNADVQSAYTIQGPPINELPKSTDLTKLKGKYNGQISKLQSKFKLKDNDGIADYHQAFWTDFVTKKSPSTLDNKTLMGLVKRWAFYDKSFRLDSKNITDEKTLEWAKGIDKNDHAKMAKDNIRPFEDIFLGIGADILSFMSSVLAANPDKAVRDMKKRLDQTIKDVRKSGDPKKITKLKLELERLNAIGGKDKIVPNEGIVFVYGGKTFKLTGTFAPLNQILGLFYE